MKLKINSIVALLLLPALFVAGCSGNAENNVTGNLVNELSSSPQEKTISIDKLEIYHFHGTHQCYSCKTVGAYAEETVNTYFADELKSGKIVFGHINGELPENKELVVKYDATGSSLWIGTYKGEEFNAEENVNVWYKISDKQAYMSYLKGVIEQKLAGN